MQGSSIREKAWPTEAAKQRPQPLVRNWQRVGALTWWGGLNRATDPLSKKPKYRWHGGEADCHLGRSTHNQESLPAGGTGSKILVISRSSYIIWSCVRATVVRGERMGCGTSRNLQSIVLIPIRMEVRTLSNFRWWVLEIISRTTL